MPDKLLSRKTQKLIPCDCKTTLYGCAIEFCPLHEAAPNLLEACKSAYNFLCGLDAQGAILDDEDKTLDHLSDVIRKAKGK